MTIRLRHYTNTIGLRGIREENLIRAADQNRVFAERASARPLGVAQTALKYGLGPGRGRHYVEFDAEPDEFEQRYNELKRTYEICFLGSIDLRGRNPKYVERKT
jgi:hypothetical protein